MYPLPADVSQQLGQHKCVNFGLFFDHYIAYPDSDTGEWKWDGEQKNDAWSKQVIACANRVLTTEESGRLIHSIHTRQTRMMDGLKGQGYAPTKPLTRKVEWRLSIGFGMPGVLDTGFALHRVYGVPYLPGSTIKGLTRHYWLEQVAGKFDIPRLDHQQLQAYTHRPSPLTRLERLLVINPTDPESLTRGEAELKELKKDTAVPHDALIHSIESVGQFRTACGDLFHFRDAFGCADSQGRVIFLDAFPGTLRAIQNSNRSLFELDIINTHFQKYYGDATGPPADYSSPNPVFFLTIRKGTPFTFHLAGKGNGAPVDLVRTCLNEAIQSWGIGAKTAAGYGEMVVPG